MHAERVTLSSIEDVLTETMLFGELFPTDEN